MKNLSDIPVRVESPDSAPADPGGLGGGVLALLREVLQLLERLRDGDEPGAIDLRSMPMVPGDRQRLEEALGQGEIEATMNSGGTTRIRETGICGVWWITHYGADDEVVAEMLEVTQVPALLVSQREDLQMGVEHLREHLTGPIATPASPTAREPNHDIDR